MQAITGRLAHLFSTRLPGVVGWWMRSQKRRFLASGGKRGNKLLGRPTFLLEVVGRKSGRPRSVMLILVRDGDDLLVAGSNGGNPNVPQWYRNLMAAGEAHVQICAERRPVRVRQIEGEERDRCWERLVATYPDFAVYQELTEREIPVAVLSRQSDG